MKKSISKQMMLIAVLSVLVLALSACGSATPEAGEGTAAPEVTSAAATTATATEAPAASSASCPVGKWQLTDFSGYMASLSSNISSAASDVTLTDQGYTGDAQFIFNDDGTSSFTADNFKETFNMSVVAGSTSMDIPIVLTINGTSTAKYSVSGDQITFSDQQTGDLQVTTDVNGTSSVIDESLLGAPGTIKLYQFSCADASSLSLKVIAVDNMDLAPLQLTRVQ